MKENVQEFLEYLEFHDLDEEEYVALESWVNEGNSPYTNPDRYCDIRGAEISYMKWYRILADHLHPERRRLMNHRRQLEDEAASIYGKPKLLKAKAVEFLNMDYSETSLNPGQDWHTGGSSFLTLKETKEHLLTEMKYIKAAFQKLLDLKETVECQMSDLDLTGNLFEDVLNVGELLAEAKISAEEFTGAYKAINTYEEIFRNNGGAIPFTGSDDLPF